MFYCGIGKRVCHTHLHEDFQSLDLVELAVVVVLAELLLGLAGFPASPATFFLLPLLKSVSYQPAPFNLNPDAEIFFAKSGFLQIGHSVRGASLNFCKASYA
jgi:hypothetical protein